ncbi:hypothetical protein [Labilibaculum antarcticum]|uniref:Uncharacterized protein n=1 Tax=Labilibaculum antarcticum TaxID=1717717 RepID=A0A1Y1CEI6_9BACT|nr:hypothetical protein [Labilibaculum antarcticum]BAX78768.1 hypothetical protein ALGA_0373 [Labilibaculum antarcticum]
MVKIILLSLLPFRGIIRAMGVDFEHLCSILKVKLMMDNRRSMSMSQKGKDSNNQLWLQSFIYAFLGGLMVVSLIRIENDLVSYTIFFAFIMVMIAMLMISEFSNVLIDTRDNSILMPRPINSRTLVLAKILHIAFYMLQTSLSLSLVMIIVTIVNHGFIAMLILLLLIVLSALFTLFLTNIFYLGLMNVVNGQKLKDIIVYFQIGMAILFMGAYQLMPRMMDLYDLANISMSIEWYSYLIPPVWMSGSFDAYINGIYDGSHLLFSLLAILIPVLSLFFVIKVLAPKFNYALAQLDVASDKKKKTKTESKEKNQFIDRLSKIFSKTTEEATAFKMVWLMSGRERKYKQSVFPSFGYILIFCLVFAFKSKEAFNLETLAESQKYLWFIYTSIFLAFSITHQLAYSDEPKSSWFYRSLPLSNPGQILMGAFKSVMVKFYLPTMVIIGSVCLYIWGIQVLDDIIFGALSIFLVTSLLFSWQNPQFPFSVERNTNDFGGNFVKGMLLMVSGGFLGGINYGLSFIPYSLFVAIPILILLLYFNLRSYQKISWAKISE